MLEIILHPRIEELVESYTETIDNVNPTKDEIHALLRLMVIRILKFNIPMEQLMVIKATEEE